MKQLEIPQPGTTRNESPAEIQSLIDYIIAAWPTDTPLLALCSGVGQTRWNRWTILAQPRTIIRHRAGKTTVQQLEGPTHRNPNTTHANLGGFTNHPLADLARILDYQPASPIPLKSIRLQKFPPTPPPPPPHHSSPPFAGGWIGSLAYDLGAILEPTAVCPRHTASAADSTHHLFEWAWCPDGILIDNQTGTGFKFGNPPPHIQALPAKPRTTDQPIPNYTLGVFKPEQSRTAIEQSVARAIEYIRAGDIFQANISQRFFAEFRGSARTLFAAARRRCPAWYMAYLELAEDRTLLSLSPELFLSFDAPTRRILTRPIKGTAPIEAAPTHLRASLKDQAELNMIVDLMRNDLGRVCEFNSVKVIDHRTIESHSTVHHGVSTIQGKVRPPKKLMDILRATLPGGSITGAPKIRAMQIIDELEPFKRGPFFGAIGFVSPATGQARFNLAIRTMLIEGAHATYTAGAGIVADSEPAREYDEMLLKTKAATLLYRA